MDAFSLAHKTRSEQSIKFALIYGHELLSSLCMGSVPDYRVCFRGLFHLNPNYRWPDHEPDLVTHRGRGLHREDDGGDLVVTIEHNGTLIVGKNRVCS